jgi:hypothetical protein
MSGIGLAYKTPEQQTASTLDANARAVTQPPAAPGIGLSTVPDRGALTAADNPSVYNDGGPEVAAPAAPAPASAAPDAPQKNIFGEDVAKPLIDFHKNPLGAIGLVLQSVAAGFNGTDSPVEKLRAQQLEQQAQQYRTASLAMDVVDKTSKFVSKLKPGDRAAAIADLDKRFSGALGGHSIAPFLTAVTAGNEAEAAARIDALKAMNVSPAMMSYFSQDPEAAIKFIDSYNAHQASKESPEEAAAKAKAIALAQGEAGAVKPQTPAEKESARIAALNAGTSAASLAETKRHNTVEEGQSANKPLTADQSNSATFADRANEAETILSKFGHVLTSAKGRILDNVPGGNAAQSADYQKASQAKTNFLMAVLRKESGAAIGKDEIATGDKQYFPQLGDTQATINQKAENRATARAGLERSAGPNYKRPAPVIHYGADGKPL